MVFSRSAGTGHAVVIRCTRCVSTTADLIAEAQALWKAEQPGAAAGRIADYWGCVALSCNPGSTIPEDILKAWADRVKQEPDYGKVTQTQAEGRLIDENGLLLIGWPTLVDSGEPVKLDLLLVTPAGCTATICRPAPWSFERQPHRHSESQNRIRTGTIPP